MNNIKSASSVDFEKLKRIVVVGYDFDFSNAEFEKLESCEEFSRLLRPSAKKMTEILRSIS